MSSVGKHLREQRTISKYSSTFACVYRFQHSTHLWSITFTMTTDHTFCCIYDILLVIPVPENLQVGSITTTTANLTWSLSEELDHVSHNFELIYHDTTCGFNEWKTIYTDCCRAVLTDLKPHRENYIQIFTNVENFGKSQESSICIFTGKCDS